MKIKINGTGQYLIVYNDPNYYDCYLTDDKEFFDKVDRCLFKKKLPDNFDYANLESYIQKQLDNNSTLANLLSREFGYDKSILIIFNEATKAIHISFTEKFNNFEKLFNLMKNKHYESNFMIPSDL